MLHLTREEKIVLVFFISCFLIGSGVSYYKKRAPFAHGTPVLTSGINRSSGHICAQSLLNINTADFARLISLKGVGPMTAIRIIDYRDENGPFFRKEDIMKVKGIGNAKFNGLKDRITVK